MHRRTFVKSAAAATLAAAMHAPVKADNTHEPATPTAGKTPTTMKSLRSCPEVTAKAARFL